MKAVQDSQLIARLRGRQRGVFSTADLRTALSAPHAASFVRRVRSLVEHGVLSRFTRGFYVAETFELAVLSQRIAPESCISFATVLARHLVIGTNPTRRIVATRVGKSRRYQSGGYEIEHLGISKSLRFGSSIEQGVQYADAERAVLDVLYFHIRGRRFPFDIYSDLDLKRLDEKKLRAYLSRYRNPKFATFARRVLELE